MFVLCRTKFVQYTKLKKIALLLQLRLVPANCLSQNFIMLIVGGKVEMQDAI